MQHVLNICVYFLRGVMPIIMSCNNCASLPQGGLWSQSLCHACMYYGASHINILNGFQLDRGVWQNVIEALFEVVSRTLRRTQGDFHSASVTIDWCHLTGRADSPQEAGRSFFFNWPPDDLCHVTDTHLMGLIRRDYLRRDGIPDGRRRKSIRQLPLACWAPPSECDW